MRTFHRILALVLIVCMFALPAMAQEESLLTVEGVCQLTLPLGAQDMTNASFSDKLTLMSGCKELESLYQLWFDGKEDERTHLVLMPGKMGMASLRVEEMDASIDLQGLQALWSSIVKGLSEYITQLNTGEDCISSVKLAGQDFCVFDTTGIYGTIPISLSYYITFFGNTMILIETMLPLEDMYPDQTENLSQLSGDDMALGDFVESIVLATTSDDSNDNVPTYPPANVNITLINDQLAAYQDLDRGFSLNVPTNYMYVTPDEAYGYLVEGDYDEFEDDKAELLEYWVMDSLVYEMTAFYTPDVGGMVGVIESKWQEKTLEQLDAQSGDVEQALTERLFDVERLSVPTRYTIDGKEYSMMAITCSVREGGERLCFFILSRTEGDRLQEINLWYPHSAGNELVTELTTVVDSIKFAK